MLDIPEFSGETHLYLASHRKLGGAPAAQKGARTKGSDLSSGSRKNPSKDFKQETVPKREFSGVMEASSILIKW